MRLVNIGSLNIDHCYHVDHFVAAGETLSSLDYQRSVGGKGLNQSVAAAHAGMRVLHAGKVGTDGGVLTDFLEMAGVDVSQIVVMEDCATGHALIQIDPAGQNCIILYPGANMAVTEKDLDRWLSGCGPEDVLLVQNEVSCVPLAMKMARARGMRVALNLSPIKPELLTWDLAMADLLLFNEVEGEALTGCKEPEAILRALEGRYPQTELVLTLGEQGSVYSGHGRRTACPAVKVEDVVDTTAAGDTFTGYFLERWASGREPEECLCRASMASAIAVGRMGAAPSIPMASEVDAALERRV